MNLNTAVSMPNAYGDLHAL